MLLMILVKDVPSSSSSVISFDWRMEEKEE